MEVLQSQSQLSKPPLYRGSLYHIALAEVVREGAIRAQLHD
eukprot:CAMPEP_0170632280 /NCGR_PEP_ID=MMETSP0224-20130122/35235_1 /TAXON_ID=285029 /ORGANISM="Togula jolla, Strain CCCM 725" /LENGTH=40 /DNA_ID= /DNA_START= /DNA_END= /DNA_ORIENTATION=